MSDDFRKAIEAQNKMNAILADLRKTSDKLGNVEQKLNAHRELWEIAVKDGNGEEENKERQMMHALLDQSLDTRSEALQLVKKFQSI